MVNQDNKFRTLFKGAGKLKSILMDPITDMLNRIRNAQAVFHPTVEIPLSKIKYEIAQILEREGFIEKVEKKGRKIARTITIILKYQDGVPGVSGSKRVSRGGQRIYLPYKKIRKIKRGYGIAILSTSKGLLTDQEARKQKVGGEVLCEIW